MAEIDDATMRVELAPLVGEVPSPDPVGVERAYRRIRTRVLGESTDEITLSRFVLLHQLGRGGMGTVLAAYDPVLERKVAIKLLRPSVRESEERAAARARLLREAQTLARISHPNVVAVYDAGTYVGTELPSMIDGSDEDGVFVVMEIVVGRTLSEWLATEPRSLREILDALAQAGQGLHAAHELGIVHRDFKPQNVMVTDDGRVRVLDFGLARVGGEPETGDVEAPALGFLTRTGTTMGTPAYMAPEQFGNAKLDARTDVYAFCVTLFESLEGRRPFEGGSVAEIQHAKRRGLATRRRDSRIPPGLHAVLARGLRPDPGERPSDMPSLLAAIERAAGRPRRRLAWALGTTGAAAILGLVARTPSDAGVAACADEAAQSTRAVWSDHRGRQIEQALLGTRLPYAEQTWGAVEQRLDGWTERLQEQRRETCELGRVDSPTERARADAQAACLDDAAARLDAWLEILGQADASAVLRAVGTVDALPDPAACAEAEPASRAPTELERADRSRLRRDLARLSAVTAAARFDEAIPMADELAEQAELAGDAAVLARALYGRGLIRAARGDHDAALVDFEAAYAASVRARDPDHAARVQITIAERLSGDRAEHDQARRILRFARADLEARDASTAGIADAAYAEGMVDLHQGRAESARELLAEALELRREALGPDHAQTLAAHNGLASALSLLGDRPAAARAYVEILGQFESTVGTHHPSVATVRVNLARELDASRDTDAAIAHAESALDVFARNGMQDSAPTAGTHDALASFHGGQGRFAAAIEHRREALRIRRAVLGESHPLVAQCRCNLAVDLVGGPGRFADALAEATAGIELVRTTLGDDHVDAAVCSIAAGRAALGLGRVDEASEHHRRALGILERNLGANAAVLAAPLRGLAEVALQRGRPEEARAALEQAVTQGDAEAPAGHRDEVALARFALARLIFDEDPARARALARQARDDVVRPYDAAELDRWLSEHEDSPHG